MTMKTRKSFTQMKTVRWAALAAVMIFVLLVWAWISNAGQDKAAAGDAAVSANPSESIAAAIKSDASDATSDTSVTASTAAGLSSDAAPVPVTEAQRKAVLELVGVVYSIDSDLVVEVEGGEKVEGASCFGVWIGSPNENTTTTMERFAVNLETNTVYLLDRVSGTYGQVAMVPFKKEVDKALETILSSPKASSNTNDYLKAHPTEVRKVVDLGDEVLPYLISFHDNGDRGLRGAIALSLCQQIHPGLNVVSTDSPNGRFRLETYGVNLDITAAGLYPANGIRLIDTEKSKVVWSMSPGYYRTGFWWSSDSRHAAIYYEARTYGTTAILDTETMEVTELPAIAELQKQTKTDITERDVRPDPYFEAAGWKDDRWVEIGFQWTGQTTENVSGRFLFDVIDKGVKGFELSE